MIPLICGIQNMTQMNLSTKQKHTCKHREQTGNCQGNQEWEGLGRLGLCKLLYMNG